MYPDLKKGQASHLWKVNFQFNVQSVDGVNLSQTLSILKLTSENGSNTTQCLLLIKLTNGMRKKICVFIILLSYFEHSCRLRECSAMHSLKLAELHI